MRFFTPTQHARRSRSAWLACLGACAVVSCSAPSEGENGSAGTGGGSTSSGSGGGGVGTASSAGGGGVSSAASSSVAAGVGAGTGGAAGTGGSAGTGSGSGTGGGGDAGGSVQMDASGSTADAGPDAPSPTGDRDAARDSPAGGDAVTPPTGQKILLNMLTTGFRHESEVPASMVLRDKLTALGFVVQTAMDPALFTDQGLAAFKVVVMVQASGQPAGPSTGVDALIRFVRAGGGLVGFHGATIIGYPAGSPYTAFLGGRFTDHPGGIRNDSCDSVGTHPSTARLAKPFMTRDEIYTFVEFNPQNQVVLRCGAFGGGPAVPISWYREEGSGRVFYTGMGHGNELWTATSPLVNDHVVPAILWAAGR